MTDDTPADDAAPAPRRRTGQPPISAWLSAGVLGVGIAIAGNTSVAHADTGDNGSARHGTRTHDTASSGATDNRPDPARPPTTGRSHADPHPAATTPPPASTRAQIPVLPRATKAPASAKTQPGPVVSVFISDGTAQHPNAGLLIGNGYTFTKLEGVCTQSAACDGGRAGLLLGNGGGGFNGGKGANGGILVGSGGNGGAGVNGINNGSGGNGGSAGLFGQGGDGGTADRFSDFATGGNGGSAGLFDSKGGNGGGSAKGANGGAGGKGGLLFGFGGRGGIGGPGTMTCAAPVCTVVIKPGLGGQAGPGGIVAGQAGQVGFAAVARDSLLLVGYNPVYPVGAEINSDGSGNQYPSQTDPTKPYAIPGTIVPNVQPLLPKGTVLTRFGFGGGYLAPTDTRFAQLSLPPLSSVQPYFDYVINDPAKFPATWSIEQSQVAPWFGQPGGGIQFRIIDDQGNSDGTIPKLVALGYLAFK